MPTIEDYIRINPLDTDNRRAVGVRFPFNAEGVFFSTFTTAEQVKSNLLNVILTEPGERILNPNFGVGLRSYLFENFIDTTDLETRINNQVNLYIPDVSISSINVNKLPDSHEVNVIVSYTVINNNNQDTIQINFSADNTVNTSDASSPNVGGSIGGSTGGSTGGGY